MNHFEQVNLRKHKVIPVLHASKDIGNHEICNSMAKSGHEVNFELEWANSFLTTSNFLKFLVLNTKCIWVYCSHGNGILHQSSLLSSKSESTHTIRMFPREQVFCDNTFWLWPNPNINYIDYFFCQPSKQTNNNNLPE